MNKVKQGKQQPLRANLLTQPKHAMVLKLKMKNLKQRTKGRRIIQETSLRMPIENPILRESVHVLLQENVVGPVLHLENGVGPAIVRNTDRKVQKEEDHEVDHQDDERPIATGIHALVHETVAVVTVRGVAGQ